MSDCGEIQIIIYQRRVNYSAIMVPGTGSELRNFSVSSTVKDSLYQQLIIRILGGGSLSVLLLYLPLVTITGTVAIIFRRKRTGTWYGTRYGTRVQGFEICSTNQSKELLRLLWLIRLFSRRPRTMVDLPVYSQRDSLSPRSECHTSTRYVPGAVLVTAEPLCLSRTAWPVPLKQLKQALLIRIHQYWYEQSVHCQ